MIRTPARWYTTVSGIFLLMQGVSTLIFRLSPPLDHAFPALLDMTQMIPIHSTLHIITGVLAVIILIRGNERGAIGFAGGFGFFYLLLGLLGMVSGRPLGLGLQPFDHPIHLALGALGLAAAHGSSTLRKTST